MSKFITELDARLVKDDPEKDFACVAFIIMLSFLHEKLCWVWGRKNPGEYGQRYSS
uniref:Uncharacterized protein n=1 Tax=viral metagenome TaxID=1070528 RepID=A0A6H1ZVR2_9ZZZZ